MPGSPVDDGRTNLNTTDLRGLGSGTWFRIPPRAACLLGAKEIVDITVVKPDHSGRIPVLVESFQHLFHQVRPDPTMSRKAIKSQIEDPIVRSAHADLAVNALKVHAI
jgi:hypothetical protein